MLRFERDIKNDKCHISHQSNISNSLMPDLTKILILKGSHNNSF